MKRLITALCSLLVSVSVLAQPLPEGSGEGEPVAEGSGDATIREAVPDSVAGSDSEVTTNPGTAEGGSSGPDAATHAAAMHVGQAHSDASADTSAPHAEDDEALVPVVVRVVDESSGVALPAAGRDVELHVVRPPHEIIATRTGVTDEDGVARFEIPGSDAVEARAELVPDAEAGDSRIFSDPIPLGGTEEQSVELTIRGTTSDPGGVFIQRLITIVAANEGSVQIQQVFRFATDDGQTYLTIGEEPGSILRIQLPDDAKGVRVQAPEGDAQHLDDFILFAGRVEPAGSSESQRPHLIVTYSIGHDNARSLTIEQPMSLDVRGASIVIQQTTPFDRYPTLDIELDVPICSDGNIDGLMCFSDVTDDPAAVTLFEGQDVRVARAGMAEAGDVMRYTTTGWPSPFPIRIIIAAVAVVLSLFIGLALILRELGARKGADDSSRAIAGLLAQRDEILAEAAALEEAFEHAELLERDYDRAREGLRQQLGVVFRRLRELGGLEDAESASADDSDGGPSAAESAEGASDGSDA